jgi:beta-glucosidase
MTMSTVAPSIALAVLVISLVCEWRGGGVEAGQQLYPFQNFSLPWATRVDDLVARLTLEEVMVQMSRGGAGPNGGPAPGIPRLGIRPYSWNTECLRGDVQAGNATSFPESIGLAAAFR